MNFIEIDRTILKTLGFSTSSFEQRDKHGNIIVDEMGNPILKYYRNGFSHAVRFLRKNENFIEGTCFEDENAHFVIKKEKIAVNKRGGAHYKNSIWIRQNKLDEWIQGTKNSRRPMNHNKQGLVYFIHQENDFDRFKIGYTTNLSERLLTLQIGTPDLLVVYKTIENVTTLKEAELHRLFSQYHIRGEWFAITPDMIDNL